MDADLNFPWFISFSLIILTIPQYKRYKKEIIENKEQYKSQFYVMYNYSMFLLCISIILTYTTVKASIDSISKGNNLFNLLLFWIFSVTTIITVLFFIYYSIIMVIYKDYFIYNSDKVYFKDITEIMRKKILFGWKVNVYHKNLIETFYLSSRNLNILKGNIISDESI